MVRDSRYVTNTAYSGAESLVISRFRCITQERVALFSVSLLHYVEVAGIKIEIDALTLRNTITIPIEFNR